MELILYLEKGFANAEVMMFEFMSLARVARRADPYQLLECKGVWVEQAMAELESCFFKMFQRI